MAPPPVNGSGGEISAAEAAKSLPTPFLNKTYQLVDDNSVDDIISWNEDGSTFIVWNPAEFARDLLPKYFKHNNFSSFIRQLNTYGFRKVVPDRWEFSNDFFRKGDKRLLCDIQRRKITNPTATTSPAPPTTPPLAAPAAVVVEAPPPPAAVVVLPATSASDSGEEQVISSNSSQINNTCNKDWGSGNASNSQLVGENDRLRKENTELNKELTHMKSLCSNIYEMMSKFGGNDPPPAAAVAVAAAESSSRRAKEPLDLMPLKQVCDDLALGNIKSSVVEWESNGDGMESEDCRTRIFGVAIGSKRRRHSDGVAVQNEEELQLRQPAVADVKVEPLDDDS